MTEDNNIPDFIGKILENREKKSVKRIVYVVAIIVNIIFLYILNNLLNWNIYFVTNALNDILWIMNIAIIATIILNALLFLYNHLWFRNLMKIFLNIFAFINVYLFYTVFPFSFNSFYVDIALKFALLVTIIIIAIVIAVEVIILLIWIINKLKLL